MPPKVERVGILQERQNKSNSANPYKTESKNFQQIQSDKRASRAIYMSPVHEELNLMINKIKTDTDKL